MSRRTKTTATFTVNIVVPHGSNIQATQLYIRAAILGWCAMNPENKMFQLKPEDFTVALKARHTTYD